MQFETTRKRMVIFSSTSLTDIVLLLLIFFMLSSTFIIQPGIKVKLPKAVTGQQDESDKIYLTVTKRETIFINQEQIGRDQLGAKLRQLLAENPERVVVIRADKDLTLEATIRVIDTAKLAGAERFVIATEQGL